MKIHTGDTVVVISGKDKGKTGAVLRVLQAKNRLVIGGVNMRTKHVRATPQRAGQKIQYEASIHASNAMLIDPKTKKRTRIGFVRDEKGKKRIAKRSGEVLPVGKSAVKAQEKKHAKQPTVTDKEKSGVPQTVSTPPKQPFWKRMARFGEDAAQEAAVEEPSHGKEDHSIPRETPPHRMPSGRGI